MLTFEDCLAFSDVEPNDLSDLRRLGTISALQAATLKEACGREPDARAAPLTGAPDGKALF
ncbi:hypothetical protein [Azospirillum sp. ST 5-10]|uniref:hypothetical protein n=1 Tax=unclassified Azospirillum TaxID=2630922 RepID=UPI003F4A453C